MSWKLQEWAWRLLPGGLASLAIAVPLKLGVFQPIEQISYQYLFQARGAMPWDDRLVLVAIDDASLKKFGRFPWSRQQYTKLLQILTDAEASVVMVDLLWSEPSSADTKLAETVAQQGRVVLAQAWDATGQLLMPVMPLLETAIASGHVMKREDNDGLVRQIAMQIKGQPALSLATAKTFSLVQSPVVLPPVNQGFWLNWVGPARTLPQHSFADVMQGKVPPQTFQNKIVLLGVTATGLDPLFTPFDREAPASSVYLHATALQNLLQQNALQPTDRRWLWLTILLGGPGLSWVLARLSTRRQLAVVVGICGTWSLMGLVLFQHCYLLPMVAPIALFVLTTGSTSLSERLREDRLLRQQMAQIWQQYHPDMVRSHGSPAAETQPPTQATGSLLSVTQLAALADQLGRSQSAQAAIARSLSVGLLAADANGIIWFCNPAASQWLQVQVGDRLVEHLVPTWLPVDQWQTSWQQLRSCQSVSFTNLNQGEQWFDLQLQPITDSSQPSVSHPSSFHDFVLLLENVTTRQRTEAELQQAKEIALQEAAHSAKANRAKTEFLAHMSHELRTPLNAILGFAQVLSRDEALSRDHQKQLAIISRSGQHLLELINDVLELAKIEAGFVSFNQTSINLYSLLRSLAEMVNMKATTKQISLVVEYDPTIPQFVMTDEGKLRQVLLNLMSNAVKFTQVGGVAVRVKSSAEQPFQLFFEVEDTGPGIAPEEIENVFDAFVQTQTGRQAKEGTGLGLSISQKFVSLMGGRITVESTLGEGTLFKFDIRVEPVECRKDYAMATQRVVKVVPQEAAYRILVIEDQPENSELLVRWLQPLGFELRTVTDGQAGIAEWKYWRPDLILMDLWMPGTDGYATTKRIRALEQAMKHELEYKAKAASKNDAAGVKQIAIPNVTKSCLRTKIIAVTADVFETTPGAIAAAGCDDIIHKPVQEQVLLAVIQKHLGVEYIYQENPVTLAAIRPTLDHPVVEVAIAVLYQQLSQMPQEWVQSLYEAALKGFDHQVLHLAQQLPATHAPLAEALITWANHYYFDQIISLVQPLILA